MKVLTPLLVLAVFVSPIFAQIPVKHDVLKVLGDIPTPPASAAEAFTRVTVDMSASSPVVSAAALFATAESALKAAEDAYKSQEATVKNAMPPGVNPDMARMAQDPEFKKKMKSMSKEERMKLAMSMMSAGGTTALKPDPPEVQAALAEWQKLATDMQAEFDRGVALQKTLTTLAQTDEQSHAAIRQWEEGAIAKLPRISSGEMDAPDPAKVKIVRLQTADKHIAAASQHLVALSKEWTAWRDHVRSRYAAFSGKLIAADYAAASPNFSSQKILSDGQMAMLKDVASLGRLSRDAFESAASWVARKRAIEKE